MIANDVSTFTSQSIDGGSITAYDFEGNPVNVQFRWADSSARLQFMAAVLPEQFERDRDASGLAECRHDVHVQLERRTHAADREPDAAKSDRQWRLARQRAAQSRHQWPHPIRQYQRHRAGHSVAAERLRRRSLQSVAVDSQNRITGSFSNGQTIPLAEIPLATFNGEDSLQSLNGDAFAATPGSGPPIYGATGTIAGSSLEASNVDIATQFSQLIVAQQAYSANAKVMSTADQMIQSLLQVIQ